MIDKNRMSALAQSVGIQLDNTALDRLDKYAAMLVEWNQKINLTAITKPEEIEVKHFLDCLPVAAVIGEKNCVSLADIGTGAGFPGMVVKIVRPQIRLTLMDSIGKKLDFLAEVCKNLGFDAELINMRAEDAGHCAELRESFDITTARAVAPINQLAEFCLPLTFVGGRFIAMKSRTADDEKQAAAAAVQTLGGRFGEESVYTLPDGSERIIITVDKAEKTDEKYPRKPAAIKKRPL